MNNHTKKWVYLILLAIIWGSSFIIIKKGLIGLTAVQLGALRIFFTAIFLFIMGFSKLKTIKKNEWVWVSLSGLMGTFFPVFLFSFAVTKIDSSIAAILNSLVPLITLIIGSIIFKIAIKKNQMIGVLIGLLGTGVLIYQGSSIDNDSAFYYNFLVVIACICYAINLNIIKSKLQNMKPVTIATGNFAFMLPPTLVILYTSGITNITVLEQPIVQESILYILILALFGTAIAKILFNTLVQISTPVFSSSVTYLIPIVAVMWGVFDGEKFTITQVIGAFIIFVGVYLVNVKRKTKKIKYND